jgi:radical SAM PhpK family P-methyltransferase
MKNEDSLDCVVIGYNEIPFERYERLLRNYGADSEAYHDLKFSFIDLKGDKLDYPALLNRVLSMAAKNGDRLSPQQEFKSGDIPNLAAVYLTNFLRRRRFRADYINLFQYEKDILIEYLAQGPLCVAITTTFYVVNLPVKEIVQFIRQYNQQVKIIVGGPLVANHARNYEEEELEIALDDIGADIYVIEGAGELTLASVVDCLKSGGSLSKVPNLLYKEDGRFHRTLKLTENGPLDENVIDWLDFGDRGLGHTLQTRTARSCAFNCSFCNYPKRAGKLTLAGIEHVAKELDSMRALGGVQNVIFIDDTFNVPLPRFKDLCRMMIQKEYGFNWFSYFRCSNADEEAIELMARSGCKGVFLGIESGSPTILKHMNKAATIEKYVDGIRLLHEHGILTFGSFIAGFPGETAETAQETIDFIKYTRPTFYRVQSWYCESGTPIDSRRKEFNIKGDGFVWSHASMDSKTAMDHIDRTFLSIDESLWLPQWSFDFWIIPYLLGRGISFDQFKDFMTFATRLLKMEIAPMTEQQKYELQRTYLQDFVGAAKSWKLNW